MMVKKILIVCNVPPYPPIHGGRMDMWNRIKGFSSLGLRIQLIYWYDSSRPSENDKNKMYEYVDSIIEVHRKMSIVDLLHYKYPPRMMSCNLDGFQFDEVLQRVIKFSPDCVWLDLWFGYLTAKKISCSLGTPLIYRSQNVEFQYFRQLYNDAVGLFKFKLFLNLIRIKNSELEVRSECDLVYDISKNDNDVWINEAAYFKSKVLLPTWLPSEVDSPSNNISSAADIDILFVGNLNNPSNISGLKWFATSVLGKIRDQVGTITIVFAGSDPREEIRSLCDQYSIVCVPNPENVYRYYDRAKVIINPQLSGSGISLKMVELLSTSKPVVTTTVGVRGMPEEVISNFCIATTPREFSEHVINCLNGGSNVDYVRRKADLERFFGLAPLASALDEIDRFKISTTACS